MIVDTSAVVAFVRQEADADRIAELLVSTAPHRMSAATRVELGLVLGAVLDEERIDEVLEVLGVVVAPLTPRQANIACDAHRAFGRGHHPARLTLGDTFSYALAADAGEPLVCVGQDFPQTDITIAPLV